MNDGTEKKKALALAGYMKEVHGNGFVAGSSVHGEDDLLVALKTKDYTCLELAPVVQVLVYRLANDQGRDLFAPHDNSIMESYFRTHGESNLVIYSYVKSSYKAFLWLYNYFPAVLLLYILFIFRCFFFDRCLNFMSEVCCRFFCSFCKFFNIVFNISG